MCSFYIIKNMKSQLWLQSNGRYAIWSRLEWFPNPAVLVKHSAIVLEKRLVVVGHVKKEWNFGEIIHSVSICSYPQHWSNIMSANTPSEVNCQM